jgi:2,5-dioxopentanoate dehydrogenase
MTTHPILLNGVWTPAQAPAGVFHAANPATKEPLSEHAFPISEWADLEALLAAGHAAAANLAKAQPEQIALFLERYAAEIERRSEVLIESAHLETGLPKEPRLAKIEMPRTLNQLRLAAAAARDGSWRNAVIDPVNGLRSVHSPLGGPVIVFGPNNFPFAFNGIAGGDFCAAIAAGNPVIAKAHPAHPNTTRLLAEAALAALKTTDLPAATIQLFYQTSHENGLKLVAHPHTAATGFTGSRPGGLALKTAADAAGKPIYLELSSVNPVVILAGALQERGEAIANELHQSCAAGAGQFCTKPGLALVEDSPLAAEFLAKLSALFAATPAGILLAESGPTNLVKTVARLRKNGATLLQGGQLAETGAFAFQPTLLSVDAVTFLKNPAALQSEAFGTVCLVVKVPNNAVLEQCLNQLEGNLTGCIYSHTTGADDATYRAIEPILRTKVGRLLNDKMPTGVAVSAAMNHGGPYPATGHPGFSAVGVPVSLGRFTALHCYDNVRHERLPAILKNTNPTGSTWRFIDGAWSQGDVTQPA